MRGDRARSALAGTRFAAVEWVEETGSTNADLLASARDGAGEGLVLVADFQSAGRGRLGRTWEAPRGSSLLLSVLLRPALDPERLHLVTMAVALGAAEACPAVAGVAPGLKWPNDLVVDDRKLAGVLAEADWRASPPAVVVGMGLNVNWPAVLPPDLAATATALNHEAGHDVDREDLLTAILTALDRTYPVREAELVEAYRQRSATLGREVRVELPAETFTGRAVDITNEGHLEVHTDEGRRTVSAGDVIHLRPV